MSKVIKFQGAHEMPPMAVSLADMGHNRTGSWRYLRPIYADKCSPCKAACPAGNDIPAALGLIAQGRFVEAWKLFRRTNPFPGVCGRVCYHPCEVACSRKNFDEPVSVAALERLVADECFGLADDASVSTRKTESIAVIGSGPAGLSCAYFLALSGYSVTIYESEQELGGMLRLGIPRYRLPRAVLDDEIERIVALGVEFRTQTRVGTDIEFEKIWRGHDAVFVATGAHQSHSLNVPGEGEPGVISGLAFLKAINSGNSLRLGPKTLVIGGGNTAIDAVRTARRLGTEPILAYRRTRSEMPAIPEEIAEAEKEGIEFLFLVAPQTIRRQNNRLHVTLQRMVLGPPDHQGRRCPVPIVNSEFVLTVDSVISAIGEESELSFLDASIQTSAGIFIKSSHDFLRCAGVFCGGDARFGPSTVIQAIASGREAAQAIQAYLGGTPYARASQKQAEAAYLNWDYFTHEPRNETAHRYPQTPQGDFSEIKLPISVGSGMHEAKRCLSCGVCNSCDNCRIFCPDMAITRNNGAYEINLDYCKGCGICAHECPRGVITLVEELQ
jgi:NADPH-dependent glutamate synthase beta subunit-like oxidoreductase